MNIFKYISLIGLLLISNLIQSQVGINIKNNIGGAFHIDGANDNDATPTVAQAANDILVSTDGKIGIGTISPTTQLHIQTTSANPALRIVDGSQANGRVLTSDANGNGRWQPFGALPIHNIALGPQKIFTIADVTGKFVYSTPITLPRGLWLIEVNMLVFRDTGVAGGTAAADFSTKVWLRTMIADTNTGQSPSADSYGEGATGRYACDFMYLKGAGYNMINGYFIINNKSLSPKTYYYMVGSAVVYPTASSVAAGTTFRFGGPANESTIFATYIDDAKL